MNYNYCFPAKVTVTQEHIEEANKVTCPHCPVELALLDIGLRSHVSGNGEIAMFQPPYTKDTPVYIIPRHNSPVREWVHNYDAALGVPKPFEFYI